MKKAMSFNKVENVSVNNTIYRTHFLFWMEVKLLKGLKIPVWLLNVSIDENSKFVISDSKFDIEQSMMESISNVKKNVYWI